MIAFMLSDEASYVNGSIYVCGTYLFFLPIVETMAQPLTCVRWGLDNGVLELPRSSSALLGIRAASSCLPTLIDAE